MKLIPVRDAKPGMVLGRPILDGQGRTIVSEGTELSQLHISRLEKWGVKELSVAVEGEQPADGLVAPEAVPEQFAPRPESAASAAAHQVEPRKLPPGVDGGHDLSARIDRTFAAVEANPLMAALRQAVRRLLLGGTGKAGSS